MFYLRRDKLLAGILMAFEAELSLVLDEQLLFRANVRGMTIEGGSRLDGLMLKFTAGQRIIVAGEAKLSAGLDEQLFIRGLMGVVAARAFTAFNRLMFNLRAGQEIFMAHEAQLRRWHFCLGRQS